MELCILYVECFIYISYWIKMEYEIHTLNMLILCMHMTMVCIVNIPFLFYTNIFININIYLLRNLDYSHLHCFSRIFHKH